MAALVDPAPDPTFRFASDRRLLVANPAGRRLLGLEDARLVGRSVGDLGFDPGLAAAIDSATSRAIETHAVQRSSRVLLESATELPRWFSILVAPIGPADGAETFVVLRDVTETVDNELRLTAMALVDPLTGVSNRAALCDRIAHALTRLERPSDYGVAVAMVDLDHFKSINDTFGHRIGDDALVEVARVLQAEVRDQDTVGRLGGDEFLLVFEDLQDPAEAEAIVNRVNVALERTTVSTPDGPVRISGSIGLAWTSTRIGLEDFVGVADRALYEAKRRGRGQVWLGGADEAAPFKSATAFMRDLGLALARDQFEVHFQPIVDRRGEVVAEEGLLRWVHPDHGVLAPAAFLAGLLETGLMGPVGQWMLRRVIGDLARRVTTGTAPTNGIHVNLSPSEIGNPHLPGHIATLIEDAGIPPALITIELTEQALARTAVSTSALHELCQLGVKVALDDFGTGASSLTHLRYRGLSAVKLDRSFVDGVLTDQRDQAIVKSTIQMALDLGLDVIAEGVETADQRDWLLQRNCTHMQGWFYGAARRPDELITT